MFYFTQVLISVDQLANALLGGWADETLSSRAWRTAQKGRILGQFFVGVIDFVFMHRGHCKISYESEIQRRQLPPEERIIVTNNVNP